MPIYHPTHIEYAIDSGYIHVNLDDGKRMPAYWAHPRLGGKYPAIAFIHDWWGITPIIRHLADLFAQSGYYVIVPDLFDGQTATTPQEAKALVEQLGEAQGRACVSTAIHVVERHHYTNNTTAVIGIGMGGSFAFDMAVHEPSLEAAVAVSGFPQRNFGSYRQCPMPVLAIYGSDEPYITPAMISRLQYELSQSPAVDHHSVISLLGIGHEVFSTQLTDAQKQRSRYAISQILGFLSRHLKPPSTRPPSAF